MAVKLVPKRRRSRSLLLIKLRELGEDEYVAEMLCAHCPGCPPTKSCLYSSRNAVGSLCRPLLSKMLKIYLGHTNYTYRGNKGCRLMMN
mgnify:CR=1 FL=1